MFLPIYLAFAPALTGQVAPAQFAPTTRSGPLSEQPDLITQRTPEDTCPNCIPGRGNIDDIVDDIVDDIDDLPPNPEPPIIRPAPPPSILDPTLPAASNQPLPDYAASVSFEVLGTTPGTPLAQSPALVDLAILSSLLPEPLLLVLTGESNPDPELDLPELVLVEGETPEGGTTTLFILQDPSGPDASAPQDPSGPDVAPSDGPLAGLAPISLQNCQDQTRSIQALPGRDRTQSVYQSLISCYEQNLEAATSAQNKLLQSYSLSNLGTAYFVTGDYLTAMATYQQQLDVARASGDRVQEGIALAGIGTTHAALGDYITAIDYYEQSLSLLTPQDAPQWRSQALRNLGNAYYAEQDYDRAQDYQRQSLQLSHSTGDRYGLMQALGNLGNLYAIAGSYDNALSAYQQSLELAQTLEIPLEMAQAQLGIGTVYAYQRNYAAAYGIYQQSLTAVRALGSRLGEGIALTNVGEALFQLDRLSEAETALVEGVNVWESLRAGLGTHDEFKVSLFETQLTTYRNLQEVLVKQNKAEPALAVAERGRARAFVELLARGKSRVISSTQPPTLEQLKGVARDRNATLVEYSIIRAQATELPHGASVQYRQQQDSALFIWVVKPSGEVHFEQVPLTEPNQVKTVAELIQTARSQIKARGGSFVSPAQIKTGDQVTRIGDVPTLAPYTVVSVDAA
ncbi:MAG: tetratricopeptide repeat protein, partial [Cyanobacteria bacterium P01_G01_bin.38]